MHDPSHEQLIHLSCESFISEILQGNKPQDTYPLRGVPQMAAVLVFLWSTAGIRRLSKGETNRVSRANRFRRRRSVFSFAKPTGKEGTSIRNRQRGRKVCRWFGTHLDRADMVYRQRFREASKQEQRKTKQRCHPSSGDELYFSAAWRMRIRCNNMRERNKISSLCKQKWHVTELTIQFAGHVRLVDRMTLTVDRHWTAKIQQG